MGLPCDITVDADAPLGYLNLTSPLGEMPPLPEPHTDAPEGRRSIPVTFGSILTEGEIGLADPSCIVCPVEEALAF